MAVIRYKDLQRNSSVAFYEIGSNFVRVQFKYSPRVYQYSYLKAGKSHVEYMKILANRGWGLNRYIKKFANNLYD